MTGELNSDWSDTCDLLVIGSGAAGFSAAVTAAHAGLTVILAEKESVFGGTTAWSGGWIWAPCNPVAKRNGIDEDPALPRQYLAAVLGNTFNPELVDAFLANAPQMVGFLEQNTALDWEGGLKIADTYGNQPGAGTGGRSVIAAAYDARVLGKANDLLRRPLKETTFWGMTIQAGTDLRAFMTMLRKPASFVYVTKRMTKHLWHLARYGRGMELRNGAALIARLLKSALDLGVDLRPDHALVELVQGDAGVEGAVITTKSGLKRIRATRGVVLASGGYPHDLARRNATFPRPEGHLTLATPASTGDGIRAGEALGAAQDLTLAAPGAYCPVSQVTWPGGGTGVFPHIIDRGKPGVIGVLANGKRFCNEGLGYHDYVKAMLATVPDGEPLESWLVCDHRFIRRYGLGIVRPAPVPYGAWIKTGYLKTGKSLADLAQACGIDAGGLAATVEAFNANARKGEDPVFDRGTTPYTRLQGDPDVGPNPCLAPIENSPFFAVKVVPGSFGTFAGLKTDGAARVLGADGAPIPGLYAAGTDMASVMGGHYPAGGINLGPALTFGYIAARHAAGANA